MRVNFVTSRTIIFCSIASLILRYLPLVVFITRPSLIIFFLVASDRLQNLRFQVSITKADFLQIYFLKIASSSFSLLPSSWVEKNSPVSTSNCPNSIASQKLVLSKGEDGFSTSLRTSRRSPLS